jgi:hypothetical protein
VAIGGDLDPVDAVVEELPDDIRAGVVDLCPERLEFIGARKPRDARAELGGEPVAMGGEFVAARGELGDTWGANRCGHGAGLEGVEVAVEGGDGLS